MPSELQEFRVTDEAFPGLYVDVEGHADPLDLVLTVGQVGTWRGMLMHLREGQPPIVERASQTQGQMLGLAHLLPECLDEAGLSAHRQLEILAWYRRHMASLETSPCST